MSLRIDEINLTNKTNLDDYVDKQVTIQRKHLEGTSGDHKSVMDEKLTGTIVKRGNEYGFVIKGKNSFQFIPPTNYGKVEPILPNPNPNLTIGGYKRRVRKSKRANKRTHKKQRTNRRKRIA